MKKINILLSLFLITSFLLAGCTQEDNEDYDDFLSMENTIDLSSESVVSSNSVNAYTSVEKAQAAIGFSFMAPSQIPAGYTQDEISVVDDNSWKIAQIDYKKENYNLTYRVSQTTDQLNFDRNTYEKEKTIFVSETEITCSCNGDIVFIARWQKDGCYYCIMSDEGLDTTTISIVIASIQ